MPEMSEETIPNQNLASKTASTTPVYFWGPSTENGYLSQWYQQPFNAPLSESSESTFTFLTAEQYMMYRKAILFNDTEIAHQILKTKKPPEQKRLGRKVKNFDGAIWNQNKLKIVEDGNYYKFVNSRDLKKMLLETDDREIVEVRSDSLLRLSCAN